MSTNQLAVAGYITVFDEEEVNIYDANDIIITVTRGALLQGWRCEETGLWRHKAVKFMDRTTILHLKQMFCLGTARNGTYIAT
jgi:hypothetical protein